jgi:predicted nucleic acid-binding protein
MSDDFFIDSNVALYLIDDSASEKKEIAISLINRIGFVSAQVIFECFNVCIKKQKLDRTIALKFVSSLLKSSYLQIENEAVVNTAFFIFEKYRLQVFDSKIVASALHAGCHTLYSEDMQHGLVVEKKMTIVNPFFKK